jgi:hypothetical protein
MTNLVQTPEFVKVLDGWLEKNDQKFASRIKSWSGQIPPQFKTCTTPLYRGMTVDESFMAAADKGVTFKTFTSWSIKPEVAKKFVNDPAYRLSNGGGTKIKILITKKLNASDIVFNIFNYVLFMGWMLPSLGMDELSLDSATKEQEVLVNKGVVIKMPDIKII